MKSEILLLAWVLAFAAQAAPARRLVATGWDSPTPSQFREHAASFEKWPFDGTTIQPVRRVASGKEVDARFAFSREHWERREFTNTIAELRAAHPRSATNNFLMLYANPGDVDWFDDASWREIAEHWRLLAWTARQGGLKGILFDAEPYNPPHAQFRYAAQPGRERHSFIEYATQARERGREIMRVVSAEFPEIEIFSFRLLCDLLPATASSGSPAESLPYHTYGLLPAFLDGWFDVMPDTVVIIEGDENAYRYNSEAEFDRAYVDLRTRAAGLLAPEHERKARVQYHISHGIYLDAHVNPPDSPWHIDRLGETPAARLRANVAAALRTADEYVWVYGETGRWWPSGDNKYPLWPEKLAGADQALFMAKNPVGAARQRLHSALATENLVKNPDFSARAENLPAQWWWWQDERSHGSARVESEAEALKGGAACITGADNGCLGQAITVSPGQLFAVSVGGRQVGGGWAGVTVRWKTAEGKWTAESRDVQLARVTGADASRWHEFAGLVQAPPGVGQLVLLLCARGQISNQDHAWFDTVRVVPMK